MTQNNSNEYNSVIERFNLRIKENKESIAFCEKIKSEMSNLEYNKDTRDYVKSIAKSMSDEYGDYRSAMLKESKKKDLIKTIIQVCDQTIKVENSRIESNKKNIQKHLEEKAEKEKRAEYSKFVDLLQPYENEYIKGFDSVREGIRQWDCLIACAEDGIINKDNISDYGIDLNIPPYIS